MTDTCPCGRRFGLGPVWTTTTGVDLCSRCAPADEQRRVVDDTLVALGYQPSAHLDVGRATLGALP